MSSFVTRRIYTTAFWLWIGIIFALYVESFGPVIRMLLAAVYP